MAEGALSPSRSTSTVRSTLGRTIPWIGFALSFCFVFLFVYSAVYHSGLFGFAGLDFGMFWAATRAFLHAGPLGPYDPHIIARYSRPLAAYVRPDPSALTIGQAPFPPVFFAAFAPFGLMPAPLAFGLWLAVSLLLAIVMARRLASRLDKAPAWLAPSLLLFFPLMFSLFLGQITVLLMWGLMEAYFDLERGRDLRAGLWCSVLLLKPQYLPILLLVMLIKARWRFLFGIGIVGTAVGTVSALMLGVGGLRDFYTLVVNNYIGFKQVQATVYPTQMISWRGMLLNMFPSAPERFGQVLTLAVTAATIAVVVLLWRGRWNPTGKRFHLTMLATVAAMLLCGYHSHLQDAALLLVPAMGVAACWRRSGSVQLLLYASSMAMPVVYLAAGIHGTCVFTAIALVAILLVACGWQALADRAPTREDVSEAQISQAVQHL